MPTRDRAPLGSPCWADLWTSDVDGSRRVLQRAVRLGGPGAEPGVRRLLHVHPRRRPRGRGHGRHGGHEGHRHLEDLPGHRRHRQDRGGGRADGAQIIAPAMPVADLGTQAVLVDPTGAPPRRLAARDLPRASPSSTSTARRAGSSCSRGTTPPPSTSTASVFRWDTDDGRRHRRVPLRRPCATPTATASWPGSWTPPAFLPEGVPAHWSVYWEVDDVDAAVAKVADTGRLGGRRTPRTPPTAGWPR